MAKISSPNDHRQTAAGAAPGPRSVHVPWTLPARTIREHLTNPPSPVSTWSIPGYTDQDLFSMYIIQFHHLFVIMFLCFWCIAHIPSHHQYYCRHTATSARLLRYVISSNFNDHLVNIVMTALDLIMPIDGLNGGLNQIFKLLYYSSCCDLLYLVQLIL